MKWWDRMPWSSFSECWALSQLFHSLFDFRAKIFWKVCSFHFCQITTMQFLPSSPAKFAKGPSWLIQWICTVSIFLEGTDHTALPWFPWLHTPCSSFWLLFWFLFYSSLKDRSSLGVCPWPLLFTFYILSKGDLMTPQGLKYHWHASDYQKYLQDRPSPKPHAEIFRTH